MYSLSGAMQFDEKFQRLRSQSNPHHQLFEKLLHYLKPLVDTLSKITLEGDLYSNTRLISPEIGPTFYEVGLCVELASNEWLVHSYPEEEANIFSLDVRVLDDNEGRLLINGVPEGFTQAKSHWCTKLDADDETVKDEHIKDINTILAGITTMTLSHNGFVSGTDLLHCIFSFPYLGKVISITATSEKVIIV
jgi:hypothetical protein